MNLFDMNKQIEKNKLSNLLNKSEAKDSPWRIPSEKAGSWMAFFKKFSIDFNRAALWGIHCIPTET